MTTPLEQSYREIPLTQDKIALVDAEDFPLVSQFKWCAHLKGSDLYAVSNQRQADGSRYQVQMSRFILGLQRGDHRKADHQNGDTLDNRRSSNLRIATHQENMHNQRRNKRNTSGFKGVYFNKRERLWRAQIRVDGKLKYLGRFSEAEAAHAAYCRAAENLHGDFARFS